MNTSSPTQPLAIIGIGCLFPGSHDLAGYWASVANRVDAVRDIPPTHWRAEDYLHADPKAPDRVYTARGAFLDPVAFNPATFGIAPNSLEATDSAQLLGLLVAQQALADAGYPSANIDRNRVSVILGVTGTLELVIPLGARLGHPIWRRALREAGVPDSTADDVVQRIADSYVGWQENSFPGLLGNVVAGRIANRFDLGGTNCVVDAACASSLSAIHLAAMELTTGRADLVLTGGVDTFNDIFMYMCFSKTPALSPTGNARPFDSAGDGTVLGEGLGMIVLKRLEDARRDGDRVYAVLRGVGSSSDGKGNAVYAPKSAGQVEALRAAHRVASVTPDTIELVEAHGTGTRVGDATEAAALAEVFGATGRTGTWCALGSVKSQIGHTKAAAGVAGIIKAAAALYHKVLPPTIKVERPIDPLGSDRSPLYVNTEKRPWLPSPHHPRRAGVSAFGFGGSNFHCILEEADPEKATIDGDADVQILAFGADTPDGLREQLRGWLAEGSWAEVRARAAGTRRDWQPGAPCRLLLVVERERTDLPRLLARAADLLDKHPPQTFQRSPDGIFLGRGPALGTLAVLFPGQGAQYPGMLRDLACHYPAAHNVLAEAAAAFSADSAGPRLIDFIYPLPAFSAEARTAHEAALRATDVAQPALGAVSLGAWRVLEHFGVRADAFAGHSYGELTALCAAGRLPSADFHALSRLRGRLLASAGEEHDRGAMLAVRAARALIETVLAEAGIDLILANKNTPEQTVLSGGTAEIERAAAAFTTRQIPVVRLSVSAAFHSPRVAAAQHPFRAALAGLPLAPGSAPVFANTTAAPYPADADAARDLLAGQLARPVEWVAEIEALYAVGARSFLEVGPGGRVTGMVDAILTGRDHDALALDGSSGQRSGFHDLACVLAWLAARGHAVQLAQWDAAAPALEAAPASAKPTLTVPLCGANYIKPRPPRAPAPTANGDHHPATNGTANLTMNGTPTSREPAPPAEPTNRLPAPPARPAPPAPEPVDAGGLTQALQITRDSMTTLHKMLEQTAHLHRQFLEGQEAAQRTVHLLVEQQQRLLQASLGLPVRAATPNALPPAHQEAPPPVAVAPIERACEAAPGADAPGSPGLADVAGILLGVVSEKTGYPAEMLELDMALDADLGIDSIKRVEILSALQERLPQAPAVKPEHLGTLHTLRHIAAFLANGTADPGRAGGVSPRSEPQPASDQGAYAPRSPGLADVAGILLGVVSEKTGYPAEMLELDMALDADLGIDSIKRVEILSALQERLPQAPAVKPEHLGTLHTLRHIAAFLANGTADPGRAGGVSPRSEPQPASDQGAHAPRSPQGLLLERSALRAVPLTGTRPSLHLAAGAEVWVACDEDDLGRSLERRLGDLGYRPRRTSFTDLASLPLPDALGGLLLVAPAEQPGEDLLLHALFGLQQVAPALRRAGTQGGAVLGTVSRLGGSFGLARLDPHRAPLDGGLAGLAKTAGREWPEAACKALDLAVDLAPTDAAAAIIDELLLAGPPEVGLSAAGRVTLELTPLPTPIPTGAPLLHPGEVVVVTGGARGVTAEVALALASAFRPTLVLLGRSPTLQPEPDWLAGLVTEADVQRELAHRNGGSPRQIAEECRQLLAGREVRRNLDRLASTGARAVYRSVDVRDTDAVSELLADVRREFGPVRGLIHGAGVLADARIEDKTPEQFQRVYATKVGGLRALLSALEPDELRALVLFSSSTARFGRTGQVDYAIANEVLNKLAHWHAAQHPDCRVLAFNWGPWEGGMVTPALRKVFEAEGIGLIPLEAGAQLVADELRSFAPSDVELVVRAAGSPTPAPLPPATLLSALPTAFERGLDLADFPVLADHVLDGRPVVPVVLILEWLAHAALHQNPGLVFHGCDDLRVLHGVILSGPVPPRVRVGAGKAIKRDGFFVAPAELRGIGPDGREVLHVRTEIVLAVELPAPPPARAPHSLAPYGLAPHEVYQQGLLFHGPLMQAIERVDGVGPAGVAGLLRSAPSPTEWVRQPLRNRWLTDPLVLDGGFQLMILWTAEQRGCVALPCLLRRYRQWRRAFPAGGTLARATVTHSTDLHAIADLDYLDNEGRLVARLEGYESILDPNLRRAFHRNQLAAT